MPARVPFTLDSLATELPTIFDQVQVTTANHQKNYVALYKLQAEAAKVTITVQNGKSVKLIGERAFEDAVLALLSRAMPIKKGESVADRVIKFVGGFTKFINEKGMFTRSAAFPSPQPLCVSTRGTRTTGTRRRRGHDCRSFCFPPS